MKGYINGIDFYEDFKAQKYWSFPSSYSQEKREMTLNEILYSGEYLAAEKKDGYWERIVKDEDGNIFMCSRNKGVNGVIEKHEWVPHLNDFFEWLPNGTVLIGEIYLPDKTSKNIVSVLGCLKEKAIKRQEKDEDKLRYYIFDILAWDGIPWYNSGFEKRVEELIAIEEKFSLEQKNKYIEFAQYYSEPNIIHEHWLRILSEGGEGMVLTHANYPYSFGKKTARKTLKLKKELEETIDVFLTGRYNKPTMEYTGKEIEEWDYWFNKITDEKSRKTKKDFPVLDGWIPVTKLWYNNWAGAVEIAVYRDNKVVPIGYISNVSDMVKEGIVENPKEYAGKVIELQAMEIDRSDELPTLRHARIVRWRDDKSAKDCTWEQLM